MNIQFPLSCASQKGKHTDIETRPCHKPHQVILPQNRLSHSHCNPTQTFFFLLCLYELFFFFLPQSLMTASGHRMSVFEVMETHGWLIITVLGASYMYLVFEVHAGTLQCWGKIHVCSTVAAFSLSFIPFSPTTFQGKANGHVHLHHHIQKGIAKSMV